MNLVNGEWTECMAENVPHGVHACSQWARHMRSSLQRKSNMPTTLRCTHQAKSNIALVISATTLQTVL